MQDLTQLIVSAVFRCQPSVTQEAARALADAIVGDLRANFRIVSLAESPRRSADKRREPRTLVIKAAILVFSKGNCSMDCQILDLTKNGARLKPADMLVCPNEFTLKLPHGLVHECEVKWRKGDVLGVRFR